MIEKETLKTLELDKIKEQVIKYSVLSSTKENILNEIPNTDYKTVKFMLDKTLEAYKLLYFIGVGNVEYFDDVFDELERSKRASILTFAELLKVASLLRSSRICSNSINELATEEIVYIKQIANSLFYDEFLENSIKSKILSDTQMADDASEKLYQIRKNIKNINERIRERLNNYMRKGANAFLQDAVVSMRNGRYVVPVKSEHLKDVKGFIHDRSQSGSTFFIEPQEILDLNNELKEATLNEKAEVERILVELTEGVATVANKLEESIIYLTDIDTAFSKAHYAQDIKGVYPILSSTGKINIKNGRHPLINKQKVVPVSVELGENFNYILISGPNTGGKTVTIKLVGLFTIMAMLGIFLPAEEETEISVFDNVYVDIGDEQSIEQNLSTFSSHLKNIIKIVENANSNSLVLIDEIGAGTDPDEGSALGKAVLERLIENGTFGILTTHYSALKEFALTNPKIINASMDFDVKTFAPLYKLRMGTVGTSNAIEIAKRLGLDERLVERAKSFTSPEKVEFNGILLEAEKVQKQAEFEKQEIERIKAEEVEIYNKLKQDREKFDKERENFLLKAKVESRKIVNEKLEVAEELLSEMKTIFDKEEYSQADLVKMATLKNKIENQKYNIESENETTSIYKKADVKTLKVGDKVFVETINSEGEILEINEKKNTAWVLVGSIRTNVKICDISLISQKNSKTQNGNVSVKRTVSNQELIKPEIMLIGMNVDEALMEVNNFLDKAVIHNFNEVRLVHGKGLKILSTAIQNYLKKDKRVDSFRFGKYGEGEHGVTIVTLK